MTLQKIDPKRLSPLQREWNKGLMVTFINNHLTERGAGRDIDKSWVIYDEDRGFLISFGLDYYGEQEILALDMALAKAKYYSKGVR